MRAEMNCRDSTARTARSSSAWGFGGADWEESAIRHCGGILSDRVAIGLAVQFHQAPHSRLRIPSWFCGLRNGAAAGNRWRGKRRILRSSTACVARLAICRHAACSGGGTVVTPMGNPHRCDSKDRSQGMAAMAMRTKASKMGSLFLINANLQDMPDFPKIRVVTGRPIELRQLLDPFEPCAAIFRREIDLLAGPDRRLRKWGPYCKTALHQGLCQLRGETMRITGVCLLVMVMAAVGCHKPVGNNLPPAEMLAQPGPGVDGPGPGVLSYQPAIPPVAAASQIYFVGPEGLTVQWDVTAPGRFDSEQLVAPLATTSRRAPCIG